MAIAEALQVNYAMEASYEKQIKAYKELYKGNEKHPGLVSVIGSVYTEAILKTMVQGSLLFFSQGTHPILQNIQDTLSKSNSDPRLNTFKCFREELQMHRFGFTTGIQRKSGVPYLLIEKDGLVIGSVDLDSMSTFTYKIDTNTMTVDQFLA